MAQLLFPRDYPEGITFERTYAGTAAIHIGELPGGGYSRIDGQPIQDVSELLAVIPPGPRLAEALVWWEHHDDEEPEEEPPAVTWRKGHLVYVESGAPLTSHAEIIQAFPEESPIQRAALEWFAGQQLGRHQAKQRQDLATGVRSSSAEAATRASRTKESFPPPKRSHKAKKSHHKPVAPREHPPSMARAMLQHDTTVLENAADIR